MGINHCNSRSLAVKKERRSIPVVTMGGLAMVLLVVLALQLIDKEVSDF